MEFDFVTGGPEIKFIILTLFPQPISLYLFALTSLLAIHTPYSVLW